MIMYKSLFRGWVEVTEEQKVNLVKLMEECATGLRESKKSEYIASKFMEVTAK